VVKSDTDKCNASEDLDVFYWAYFCKIMFRCKTQL